MSERAEDTLAGESPQRLLALSDGVFAIAITLLTLELRVPVPGRDSPEGVWRSLALLLNLWPSLVGYLLSFIGVGILWHNHCVLFKAIRRCNHLLTTFNTLLLMMVALVPFPTGLLAQFLPAGKDYARAGALVYCAWMTLIAIAFNLVWGYAVRRPALLDPSQDPRRLRAVAKRLRFGPLGYLAATFLALVHVPWCLVVLSLLAFLFSLPYDRDAITARLKKAG